MLWQRYFLWDETCKYHSACTVGPLDCHFRYSAAEIQSCLHRSWSLKNGSFTHHTFLYTNMEFKLLQNFCISNFFFPTKNKKIHGIKYNIIIQYLLDTSTWTEWSITRSTGQSGLILSGSPPSLLTASRMAAKSTTAGTPLMKKYIK